MDDLPCSLVPAEAAIDARLKIQELLAKGGFHIRKWLSNSKTVMDSIPPGYRAPGTVLDVGIHNPCTLPVVKTLGVSWSAEEDVFTFLYNVPEVIGFNKRSALKGLATVFDPRGLIAPFTGSCFKVLGYCNQSGTTDFRNTKMPVRLCGLLNFLICSI